MSPTPHQDSPEAVAVPSSTNDAVEVIRFETTYRRDLNAERLKEELDVAERETALYIRDCQAERTRANKLEKALLEQRKANAKLQYQLSRISRVICACESADIADGALEGQS